MAQIFPLNNLDEAPTSLADTLAALPDPWTLLCDRPIGDDSRESVGVVLIHPDIGIALVDEAPRDPKPAVPAFQAYLERERFAEFFPGELPIVALSVAADDIPLIGEQLEAAFDAAPRLTVADRDWADAVIELLLLPSDLSMAPASGRPGSSPAAARAEAMPQARRVSLTASPLNVEQRSPTLTADWPVHDEYDYEHGYGYGPRPKRRGRWIAAAVGALALLVGLALAAWMPDSEDEPEAAASAASWAQVEVPLAAPSAPSTPAPGNTTAAAPTSPKPPPVPAAPPVILAAKPLASPPPPPPAPSRVAALPSTLAGPAPPPAGRSVDTPPPQRTAAAETIPVPKPVLRREAAVRTGRAYQPAPPNRPPFDAADLPPIDEPASTSGPVPTRPPPEEPVNIAVPPAPGALGAPTPLLPPQALNGGTTPRTQIAAAPGKATLGPDCRPYTADSTLSGRSLAVQGTACRGSDGQWRLVSEVPLR